MPTHREALPILNNKINHIEFSFNSESYFYLFFFFFFLLQIWNPWHVFLAPALDLNNQHPRHPRAAGSCGGRRRQKKNQK